MMCFYDYSKQQSLAYSNMCYLLWSHFEFKNVLYENKRHLVNSVYIPRILVYTLTVKIICFSTRNFNHKITL